jgi:PAS domain S-box-containing protein
MTRKDGSTLWVEACIAFLRDAHGHAVGLVGVSRDIADRRRAEWALKESERWFRLLAESLTDVIWTVDLDLRFTYISPSVARLWGYRVEEAMALTPGENLTARSLDAAKRALVNGSNGPNGSEPPAARTLELPFLRKDGSTAWTETSVRFLNDHAGCPVGILGVSRDITERRQIEEMKADFVTLTTHQLRTPLTGIKWLLELAAGDRGSSEATRLHIRDAEAAADRLIEIVNNLLDSANLESGTLNVTAETTDLGDLTRSVLEELDPAIRDKRCQVVVSGADEIGTTLADPKLLRQAILNLVSNAVKYTPPAGRIAIRMRRDPSALSWEIEDTGIGVPAAARSRLFQKFYRADNAYAMAPEGTGLGLYLARLIVERFSGRLWFESEEGRGSTFGLTLPLGS